MSTFRLAAAGAIATVITALSMGAAQAYPDCGISLTLNNSTVVGGDSFSFKADAGKVDCDWVVTFAGQSRTGNGTSISGTFDTSKVSKKATEKITATCTFDDEDISASPSTSTQITPAFYSTGTSATLQAALRTCPVSANVSLLPKGVGDEDANGVLPDTGGSNLWILVLGGALVAGGAGVTYAARRRHSAR